jgi:nicotinamide mononucleotide transporter
MNLIEIIAAIIALLGVLLTARSSILGWPLGIVGAGLYSYIFIHSVLYAEGVLQSLYVIFGIYGWWSWNKTNNSKKLGVVKQLGSRMLILSFLSWILASILCGWFLDNYSKSEVPYLDSILAVGGLLTTYLLAKKYLQNWLFWIAIDLVSATLFFQRELYATSVLYIAFTAMAIHGYFHWKKELELA